jgi:hypothetical protein
MHQPNFTENPDIPKLSTETHETQEVKSLEPKEKQKQQKEKQKKPKEKQKKPKEKQKEKKRKREKKKDRENNMTVLRSIQTNYLSWIFLAVSVYILSYPNVLFAYVTFFILMFCAYFWHAMSHMNKYLSIIHYYHHEHNNFFSHFSQMLIELSLGAFPFFSYQAGYTFFDPWIVIFFTLFYTTIHNFNYGTLRVNNVHKEHHEELFCNLGPDICDVAFGTKSDRDTDVENTNHYIPNIIALTVLILFLQYICKNASIYKMIVQKTTQFYIFVGLFLGISTVYLTLESIYTTI